MKQLLYISYADYKNNENLGIIKKIEGQKNAFRNAGYQINQLKIADRLVYINDTHIFTLKNRIDYWVILPLVLKKWFRKNYQFYDIIYIRKELVLLPLYKILFRQFKKQSANVLMEIPTYPYKMEIGSGFKGGFLFFLDCFNNLLIRKDIDYIITTQNYDTILGIKTIKIKNGYDFSNVRLKNRERKGSVINLISVSNFHSWHGTDRVLYGLYQYYRKKESEKYKVILHLVGEGIELTKLQQLSKELQLEDVIFYGPKSGNDLDRIYDQADVGIGSLALHRLNLDFTSTLKSKEYCYCGIPFIIGNPDPELKAFEFVLEFPNDNTPIDIDKVIHWYHALAISAEEIQDTGRKLYDWDVQINKILRELAVSRS